MTDTKHPHEVLADKLQPGPFALSQHSEQCAEAARFYCGCYRHHFRVQIQIDPATRLPI